MRSSVMKREMTHVFRLKQVSPEPSLHRGLMPDPESSGRIAHLSDFAGCIRSARIETSKKYEKGNSWTYQQSGNPFFKHSATQKSCSLCRTRNACLRFSAESRKRRSIGASGRRRTSDADTTTCPSSWNCSKVSPPRANLSLSTSEPKT